MKKILTSALVASTMAMAGGNIAEVEVAQVTPELTGIYVGAGYTYLNNTESILGVDISDSANAGTILAGYNFNDYVALEGRYTFTADIDFSGRTEIDGDVWGIYVKPQYPVSADCKVYALLGYGETFDSDGGFQYGLGGAYSVNKNVEVFADYIRTHDDTEYTVLGDVDYKQDVFTVGLNYKF
jgi:predicted porin